MKVNKQINISCYEQKVKNVYYRYLYLLATSLHQTGEKSYILTLHQSHILCTLSPGTKYKLRS